MDLGRNCQLSRKISLRESYRRKLAAMPVAERWKAINKSQARSMLKRQSKGLKAQTAKYRKVSAVFLSQPENKWCLCCDLRREKLGENIIRNQATEIHHHRGRIGRLLCWVPGFRPFCHRCRSYPHSYPKLARQLNLLASPTLWNVFPEK